MIKCLNPGDEPVGIKVCASPVSVETAPTEFTPVNSVVGFQVFYGQEAPRCRWAETADKSEFQAGPEHGKMSGGTVTCETKWFNGWQVEEFKVYVGSDTNGNNLI